MACLFPAISLLCALSFTVSTLAQIEVKDIIEETLSALDLVDFIVADDAGLSTSSTSLSGTNTQFGKYTGAAGIFTGNADSVDMSSGVVISTGLATDINGEFSTDNVLDNYISGGESVSDADVSAVSQGITMDAATLEFAFVPIGTRPLRISLAFGSWEYFEMEDTTIYNDAAVVMVNGVNCALTAKGSEIMPNLISSFFALESDNFVNNSAGSVALSFYGLTKIIEFECPIIAGATNTLKIAIADSVDDTGDQADLDIGQGYDSAVFIPENGISRVFEGEACEPLDSSGMCMRELVGGDSPNLECDVVTCTGSVIFSTVGPLCCVTRTFVTLVPCSSVPSPIQTGDSKVCCEFVEITRVGVFEHNDCLL